MRVQYRSPVRGNRGWVCGLEIPSNLIEETPVASREDTSVLPVTIRTEKRVGDLPSVRSTLSCVFHGCDSDVIPGLH